MTDVILTPITSGYQLSKINDNFDKIEDVINSDVVHVAGGNNTMHQDLDLNGNDLLNVNTNPDDPASLVTIGVGDARWYNIKGDSLEGTFNAAGHTMTGLKEAEAATEAVRKQELDEEIEARASGDASLQDQLNGTNPPMGSAFSEISWHGKVITNSIVLPDNVNAWSFGPTMTIATGQFVTIPANSYWTIANGATTGDGTLAADVPDPLDFGVL